MYFSDPLLQAQYNELVERIDRAMYKYNYANSHGANVIILAERDYHILARGPHVYMRLQATAEAMYPEFRGVRILRCSNLLSAESPQVGLIGGA
jgi:hypothetical protein